MSIVRSNLIKDEGYSPYCGQEPPLNSGKLCPARWPRSKFEWSLKQFKCPSCGWVSDFDPDFITEYIDKWKLTKDTKFRPCPWA